MLPTRKGRLLEVRALPELDGLRGVAALIVMIYHGMAAYGPGVWYGYGVDQNFGIHQLPVVRALFDGSSMVFLFYTLSGFLLSLKPLSLIRQRRWEDALQTLSSSAIRRPLRLFLPALLTTNAVMMLHWAGFFEYAGSLSTLPDGRRLTQFELPATRFSSFRDQLADWYAESVTMMNPFTWDRRYNPYNSHLWTLTAQLRASCVGFLVLLTGARLDATVRVALLCGMVMLFAKNQKWEIATTLSGILLAELQLFLNRQCESKRESQRWTLLVFLAGIFLASYPKLKGEETPGFRTVSALTPPGLVASKWWKSAGAWLLLWAANNSPQARWLFTTRASQYLGEHPLVASLWEIIEQ
ncbi:hypothetical protein DL767_002114 [Monosporascus sp. MG133]|nr:hypothetical protein DL767_002114 [Monosporascus sp. MG133]